jgi:hypothetical protein
MKESYDHRLFPIAHVRKSSVCAMDDPLAGLSFQVIAQAEQSFSTLAFISLMAQQIVGKARPCHAQALARLTQIHQFITFEKIA